MHPEDTYEDDGSVALEDREYGWHVTVEHPIQLPIRVRYEPSVAVHA